VAGKSDSRGGNAAVRDRPDLVAPLGGIGSNCRVVTASGDIIELASRQRVFAARGRARTRKFRGRMLAH
jgi:hypothetical protein